MIQVASAGTRWYPTAMDWTMGSVASWAWTAAAGPRLIISPTSSQVGFLRR